MMFLYTAIRAEVAPVAGRKGWYQLTGQHIERWTMDPSESLQELTQLGVKVDYDARILGIHDFDPELERFDPRFNHENDPDSGTASFGVFKQDGRTYMLLAVNYPEYVLFRHLCPLVEGEIETTADVA